MQNKNKSVTQRHTRRFLPFAAILYEENATPPIKKWDIEINTEKEIRFPDKKTRCAHV